MTIDARLMANLKTIASREGGAGSHSRWRQHIAARAIEAADLIEAQSAAIERVEAERDRLMECAMLYRAQWLDANDSICGKREPGIGESDPLAPKEG